MERQKHRRDRIKKGVEKNCRLHYYPSERQEGEREREREGDEMNNGLHVLSPRVCTVKADDVIIHTRAASLTKTLLSFKLPVHNVLLMDFTNTNITICINGLLLTLTKPSTAVDQGSELYTHTLEETFLRPPVFSS